MGLQRLSNVAAGLRKWAGAAGWQGRGAQRSACMAACRVGSQRAHVQGGEARKQEQGGELTTSYRAGHRGRSRWYTQGGGRPTEWLQAAGGRSARGRAQAQQWGMETRGSGACARAGEKWGTVGSWERVCRSEVLVNQCRVSKKVWPRAGGGCILRCRPGQRRPGGAACTAQQGASGEQARPAQPCSELAGLPRESTTSFSWFSKLGL